MQEVLENFNHQRMSVKLTAIELMSQLLSDIEIHDIVQEMTDFNFLLSELQSIVNPSYDEPDEDEHRLLLSALKIFGGLSKTPKMVERNMTNGIMPLILKIVDNDNVYSDEERIWALIIVNRGCMHHGMGHEFLD